MPYKDPIVRKQKAKEFNKSWYKKNKLLRRKQLDNKKLEVKNWLREYKTSLRCVICGENHPACLDFHHRDPKNKTREVSVMSEWGYSVKRILEEISKCDVLCANCHRKLHYNGV